MRRALIVCLVPILCGCAGLMTTLDILQDPATQLLITDIRILLDRLNSLNNAPAETETARAAIEEQKATAIEAIGDLVSQLEEAGDTKAARRYERELESLKNGPS